MSATLSPKLADLLQRSQQCMQEGRFAEAEKLLARAIRMKPDLADAHAMRAEALMRNAKLADAHASAERALRLRPGWGEAMMLRGNVEALLERFAAAEASYREAMKILGATPGLQANLGNVLHEQQRWDEALAAYDAALAGRDAPELRAKRAHVLQRLGRREDAQREWQLVLARDPASLEALEQLLQIHMGARRTDELEQVCTRGITLAPAVPVFHLGYGLALWWRRRHEEALAQYREAARLALPGDREMHDEAVFNEAMCLLKLGRLREGWERYGRRADRAQLRERFPQLAPDPAAIAAAGRALRIRIHTEQGIGDELFFLRFAPLLRARGHRLSYRGHVKLVPLLASLGDLFDWVGRADDPAPAECDVELFTADLALASGASAVAPSLRYPVEEARREAIAERLRRFGPPPYFGVTWRAGLIGEEQKDWGGVFWLKLVPPEALGAALRAARGTVVIAQRKPDAAEVAAFKRGLGRDALDMGEANEDLADALALLSLLDEYIGVSNTNMHLLAGLPARGVRALLQNPAEWRWGVEGDESPWFPGFRLYRQGWDRSWVTPLAQLASDLKK